MSVKLDGLDAFSSIFLHELDKLSINKWQKIREFKLVYLKTKEIEKEAVLSFDCCFNSVQ